MVLRCVAVSAAAIAVSTIVIGAARGSPYETIDMDAATQWEMKGFVDTERTSRDSVTASGLDLTAPIRPGLEASFTVAHGWIDVDEQRDVSGPFDPELAVKWEVVPRDASRVGLTIEPTVVIPASNSDVSENAWIAALPIAVSRAFDRSQLTGMIGYAHAFSTKDTSAEDSGTASLLASYDWTRELSIGFELVADFPRFAFAEDRVKANVGFKWQLSPQIEIQALLGRTIHVAKGEHSTIGRVFIKLGL